MTHHHMLKAERATTVIQPLGFTIPRLTFQARGKKTPMAIQPITAAILMQDHVSGLNAHPFDASGPTRDSKAGV
jgi:hypothetical protein